MFCLSLAHCYLFFISTDEKRVFWGCFQKTKKLKLNMREKTTHTNDPHTLDLVDPKLSSVVSIEEKGMHVFVFPPIIFLL